MKWLRSWMGPRDIAHIGEASLPTWWYLLMYVIDILSHVILCILFPQLWSLNAVINEFGDYQHIHMFTWIQAC